MDQDRQTGRGEYWWRQPQPALAALAALDLPHRLGIAVSHGAQADRQSLSLLLQRSETGLDHLVLQTLEYRGDGAPAVTQELFTLLLNTTVAVLQRHCSPQLSLGGAMPTHLRSERGDIELPWQQFGFQLLRSTVVGRRRIFARVGKLQAFRGRARHVPVALPWEEVQWRRVDAAALSGQPRASSTPAR